jgi:hypothetical protein
MFGIGVPELIIIFIISSIGLVPGIAGAYIAGMKGRSKLGWFFICAICPLCIIAIIFLPPVKEIEGKYKQCPACKEFVKWEATICKHCRSEIN